MNKPYYETKLGKLYHGDCLEIMPELEPVDLVLTDPPYGITKNNWDIIPTIKSFNEIFKISKKQLIFGGHFMDLPKKDGWLIWDKMPFLKTTNQVELIWTSFLKKNKLISFRYAGNVIGDSKKPKYKREKAFFTSEKPFEFIELLIKKYSIINELILDSYLGTGTTAVACEHLKRRWIGIDIEEKHCEMAAKRIEENLTIPERIERCEKGITKKTTLLF